MNAAPKAVILLSGGLDSATVLAESLERGFEPCALSFRYGQRHESELRAAARVARQFSVAVHKVLDVPLGEFGGSALTADIAVPEHHTADEIDGAIPVTYVPARNTIFLALALGWAEVLGARDIFVGVNALDYSGYPDCRPEYIAAFQAMANLATKAAVEGTGRTTIHTPLIDLSKSDIIRRGLELGVDYSLTVSCYQADGEGRACGRCDSCLLRQRGFAENGLADPAPRQNS